MTDSPEPEKDTVRIALPAAPQAAGAATAGSRETTRIHLPTRPPPDPAAAAVPTSTGAAPNVMPTAASTPKKETARISVLPVPSARVSVQMKKTQPLIDLPPAQRPEAIITVAPAAPSPSPVEIPMFLCWALLGVSAAILILQIWNYVS